MNKFLQKLAAVTHFTPILVPHYIKKKIMEQNFKPSNLKTAYT